MGKRILIAWAMSAAALAAVLRPTETRSALLATAPATVTTTPATRPALAPIDGWKAQDDPVDIKGHFRGDLKLTAPIKGGNRLALSGRPGPFIAVLDDNWGDQGFTLLDLRTGTMAPGPRGKLALEEPFIISPDGQYLVARSNGKPGEPQGQSILSFKTRQLVRRIAPAADQPNPTVIGFLDGDRLLTYVNKDFKPSLQVWEIKTGKLAAELQLEKLEVLQAGISPGGKFIALVNEDKLQIYTAGGQLAGEAPMPPFTQKGLTELKAIPKFIAFAPDGAEVAAWCEVPWHGDQRRIIAWDMPSGQVVRDLITAAQPDPPHNRILPFEYVPGGIGWRFDRAILETTTGRKIYDIPQSRPGHEDDLIRALDAGHVVEVSEKDFGGKGVQISTLRLPQEELAKATVAVRAGGNAIDVKLPPALAADWTRVNELTPAKAAMWSPASDAGKQKEPEPVSIGNGIPLQSKVADALPYRVAFSGGPGNAAAVTYHQKSPSGPVQRTVVQSIALATKQSSIVLDVELDAEALDLSSDGKLVLIRTGPDRVDLYSTSGVAKQICGWRPYEKDPSPSPGVWNFPDRAAHDVAWGAIVDETHVLTCSGSGKLTRWSVPGCKAEWTMPVFISMPALSPSRKLVACASHDFVQLLDSQSGQVRGAIATARVFPNTERFFFRPDGAQLLRTFGTTGTLLSIWNLSDGKVANETTLNGKMNTDLTAAWCGDHHLMVGGAYLVNLDLHTPVWQFATDPPGDAMQGQPDGRFWKIIRGVPGQPATLSAFNLPQDDAKRLEATLAPESLIKPGTKVTVQTNLVGDAANQQKIADALKEQLTTAGLTPADGQPIQLMAAATQRGSFKMEYITFGGGKGSETIDVPEYVCRLSFVVSGKEVWFSETNAGGSAPRSLRLEKGQTIQQYINKLNENPGAWFFEKAHIPGWVGKPLETLNLSRLTPAGAVLVAKK